MTSCLCLAVFCACSSIFPVCICILCEWDMSLTDQQRIDSNCGFRCPDAWKAKNPHYCGAPFPCCCAPKCSIEKAKETAFVGVNWSDKYARRHLDRRKAFAILKNNGFSHIKLFSPDGLHDIKQVYGDAGNVHVALPNKMLTSLSSDPEFVNHFIKTTLAPFKEIVRTIIVGNEPFICIKTKEWGVKGECGSLNAPAKLLPAMKRVKEALAKNGMSHVPVTSAFNGGILEMAANPWTPCVSDFKEHLKELLPPVWDFLQSQEPPAPFIVNIYSWFAAMSNHVVPAIAVGHPHKAQQIDGRFKY